MRWPANVWHGAAPADPVDPDARAALLEREFPGIVALRNSGSWPWTLTEDQAARAAEDTIDRFIYIAKQEKREDAEDELPNHLNLSAGINALFSEAHPGRPVKE